jgi:hypothetical protein
VICVCVAGGPGGVLGSVCGAPGGACGFWVGDVVPGMGSCPGGLVGSPGAGDGLGVACGVCAVAAPVPANTMHASTAGLIRVRDMKLSIRQRAP